MGIIDDLKMQYRTGGIVQRLIFWNVGLFVIPMVAFSLLSLFNADISFLRWDSYNSQDWLSLSSNPADLLWKPWSLIAYAFLHADFLHILFNMLILFFSGRMFLTYFTQKQLFGLYILAAVFSGLVYIAGYSTLPMLGGIQAKMVGASGAIMAILVAVAVYAPHYQVRLLLIGTVKLWHIALVFIILDLIRVSSGNSGGHIAHLAGALSGFIYIKLLQNGTDLTKGISAVLDNLAGLFRPAKRKPFRKVHRNSNAPNRTAAARPSKDMTQQQIDDILDKISKSGYDSLTKAEKEFLFKVGK